MSSFEKYLGAGWYPLEFSGQQPFVWSKKEAYLNFARLLIIQIYARK